MSDWDGSEYRKVSDLQQWLADRALDGLNLDGVRSLLDIGCGDGRITAEIARRIAAATVVGLDPSPRMISIAPAGRNLTFELGDVYSMTYQSTFDAVVSFNALHWVLDQRLALSRIAAALRPSGWAFLVFVCAGERPSLESVAMKVVRGTAWQRYFEDFDAPFIHPDVGVGLKLRSPRAYAWWRPLLTTSSGISSLATGSVGGAQWGLAPGPTAYHQPQLMPLSAMSSTRMRTRRGLRASSDSCSSGHGWN